MRSENGLGFVLSTNKLNVKQQLKTIVKNANRVYFFFARKKKGLKINFICLLCLCYLFIWYDFSILVKLKCKHQNTEKTLLAMNWKKTTYFAIKISVYLILKRVEISSISKDLYRQHCRWPFLLYVHSFWWRRLNNNIKPCLI